MLLAPPERTEGEEYDNEGVPYGPAVPPDRTSTDSPVGRGGMAVVGTKMLLNHGEHTMHGWNIYSVLMIVAVLALFLSAFICKVTSDMRQTLKL